MQLSNLGRKNSSTDVIELYWLYHRGQWNHLGLLTFWPRRSIMTQQATQNNLVSIKSEYWPMEEQSTNGTSTTCVQEWSKRTRWLLSKDIVFVDVCHFPWSSIRYTCYFYFQLKTEDEFYAYLSLVTLFLRVRHVWTVPKIQDNKPLKDILYYFACLQLRDWNKIYLCEWTIKWVIEKEKAKPLLRGLSLYSFKSGVAGCLICVNV